MNEFREFQPEEFALQSTDYLKQTVSSAGASKVIIGLSGGIDSAVVFALAIQALGPDNVIAVSMPYSTSSKESLTDAEELIVKSGLPKENYLVKPISPMVDAALSVNEDSKESEIRIGNISARCRMIILFDLGKKHNSLVLGTENRTENLMGYFTRFGDEASDIELIHSLYKTEVRRLAEYLDIPENIRTKAPSADLWPGQSDEEQIGASYEDMDQVIYYNTEGLTTDEIFEKTKIPKDTIETILNWKKANDFKHQVPYIFKN